MIVINQLLPGSFEVSSDVMHTRTMDNVELLEFLNNELKLNLEFDDDESKIQAAIEVAVADQYTNLTTTISKLIRTLRSGERVTLIDASTPDPYPEHECKGCDEGLERIVSQDNKTAIHKPNGWLCGKYMPPEDNIRITNLLKQLNDHV